MSGGRCGGEKVVGKKWNGSEQLLEIMDNAQSHRSGTIESLVSMGVLLFGAVLTGILMTVAKTAVGFYPGSGNIARGTLNRLTERID